MAITTTSGASQPLYDIVPTHLAVQAMRDSGYKNAAYALAELIDNSIQATAQTVQIICAEKREVIRQRQRRRISQIGILDDGKGMNAETLRIALQFGNGTHLNDRDGIGRFGMGLPNASISQCRRVDVWSWQDGEPPLYTYLDMTEMQSGHMSEVPKPTKKSLPAMWKKACGPLGKHGTLVVWSDIDRCVWKTALSVQENSEEIIGRIYRRHLSSGKVKILLRAFVEGGDDQEATEYAMQVNDPLFLMAPSCCPAPFHDKPMFKEWGEPVEVPILYQGKKHIVTVRFSIATDEARAGDQAGAKDYGKLAMRNAGISLIRAHRELELDRSWLIGYDPVERWWGAEVDFPPALDEIFGVTNDKQHARVFTQMAELELKQMKADGSKYRELKERWEDEDDPRAYLLDLAHVIQRNLSLMRKDLEQQQKGVRPKRDPSNELDPAALDATRGVDKRKQEGNKGLSDEDEKRPTDERTREVAEELEKHGVAKEEAKERARLLVHKNVKFEFRAEAFEGPSFFTCSRKAGIIFITLNSKHQAFDYFVGLTGKPPAVEDVATAKAHLDRALTGLELLLASWARYEDEVGVDETAREYLENIRTRWGMVARDFMRNGAR